MLLTFIQLLIGGLLLGGIYALAAFGLSICFGVLNILNIAHGEFLMLGSLLSYSLFAGLGLNPFLSIEVIIPVFFILGTLFHTFLLKPISNKPEHELLIASILVTLGASLAIEDLTSFFWTTPITGIDFSLPAINIGSIVVSSLRLVILGFIVLITIALHLFLKKTFTGKAIRAITQDRNGARIVGINLSRISSIAFSLGISMAAAAGVFYVTLFTVTPVIGIPLTIKYLCIIVLGGLGSLFGSLTGGIILGISEALTGYYIGTEWSPTVAFIILIVILIIRPEGLFGRKV